MSSLYIIHESLSSTFADGNTNIEKVDNRETIVEQKIARPSNAFILYRRAKHDEITNLFKIAGIKIPFERDISRIISQLWKEENDATRTHYKRQADMVAAEHQKEHPWYKYQPQQKKKNHGIVKQTQRVTKKKTVPQKSTQIITNINHTTPPVENDNDESLLPTSLPSQCLSQDDLANLISSVDFQNLDINLYNNTSTMNINYQNLTQLDDNFFDYCV